MLQTGFGAEEIHPALSPFHSSGKTISRQPEDPRSKTLTHGGTRFKIMVVHNNFGIIIIVIFYWPYEYVYDPGVKYISWRLYHMHYCNMTENEQKN